MEKTQRRTRKRWIDALEKDIKILGIEDQRGAPQDRDRWRTVVKNKDKINYVIIYKIKLNI